MIRYRDYVLAGPPCPGFNWMREAGDLWETGQEVGSVHSSKSEEGDLVVSVVCHPYRFWWYVWLNGWLDRGAIDVPGLRWMKQTDSFLGFIQSILRDGKNQIFEIYQAYNATMCLRCEDFPHAPVEFFESMDRNLERGLPEGLFQEGTGCRLIRQNEEFSRLICEHEPKFCELYGYFP